MKAMNFSQFPDRQRGTTLIVALLLLVAMMLISLAGIRGSGLEERMGANLYDRQLAFQAAESALREGETTLLAALGTVSPEMIPTLFNGTNGRYPQPDPSLEPRWTAAATVWRNATTVATGPRRVTPQYIIEYMGEWPNDLSCQADPNAIICYEPRYRITARHRPDADGAVVMLQSTFRR